jgi:lysozyme
MASSFTWKYTSQDVDESIKHIMKEEGFAAEAYPDPFSPLGIELRKPLAKRAPRYQELYGTPWTIGYGRTGPDVMPGTKTTKDQEIFWLKVRVTEELQFLQKLNCPTSAGLVGLIYNIGKYAFKRSQACRALQEGRWEDAYREIAEFNKSAGKVRAGLTKRRLKEIDLLKEYLSRNLHSDTKSKA